MRYTIFDLQRDCMRKLSTSAPASSLDFHGAIDEARRNMLKRIAPPEMIRSNYLEDAIYEHPERYAVPDDFHYDKLIDLQLLPAYRNVDTMQHPLTLVYSRRFDNKRVGARNVVNISYLNGLKTAGIYRPRGLEHHKQRLIDNCDTLDQTGFYTTTGNVVNLTIDPLTRVQGKGALKFDFNNSLNGSIEKVFTETIDLYDFLKVGAWFASFSINLPKVIQSVTMKLYSSPTDYFEFAVNHPHDSNQFKDKWNILKFQFDQEFAVGTPNAKAITGYRIDFVTDGTTCEDNRLDNIFMRKGAVYEATYQSSFCIIDPATGVWKHRANDGTDLLPFEDDSYQVFMLETAMALQKELYTNNSSALNDVTMVKADLDEAYEEYLLNHPDEAIQPYETTYIMGNEYDGTQDDPINHGFNQDYSNFDERRDYYNSL